MANRSLRIAKMVVTEIGPHLFNRDVISMPDKWNIPGMRPGI